VGDLERIWDEWASRCTSSLARLCLLVTEEHDEPAAASARAFLDARSNRPETTAGASLAAPAPPQPARALLDSARTLQTLSDAVVDAQLALGKAARQILEAVDIDDLVPEELADAVVTAASKVRLAVSEAAILLAESELDVPLTAPVTASLQEAARMAMATADAHERRTAAERDRAALLDRRDAAVITLYELETVEGPEEYGPALQQVRGVAVPPKDETHLPTWLVTAPVLRSLVEHLRGGRPLDPASYEAVSDSTSPLILGLALAGKLRLNPKPQRTEEPETQQTPAEVAETPTPPDSSRALGDEAATVTQLLTQAEAAPQKTELPPPASAFPPSVDASSPPPSPQRPTEPDTDAAAERPSPPSPPPATEEPLPQLASIASERSQSVTESVPRPQTNTEGGESKWAPQSASVEQTAPPDSSPLSLSPSSVWGRLHRLLNDGHLGAAAWAAQGFRTDWGASLEVLALAAALRNDTGPLSAALWTRTQAWDDLPKAPAAHALAAGLCLAALTAPFAGAPDVLELLEPQLRDKTLICDLSAAVITASRQGLVLGSAPVVQPDTDAVVEQLAGARAAAKTQLETASARTLKFHRATRVYQAWMAEDGLLGKLLVAVRDDQQAQVDDVRRGALALHDDKAMDRAVGDTDSRIRGPQATTKIHSDPRLKLIELAREALAVVDVWCRAVTATQGVDHGRHPDNLANDVRRAATAVLDQFHLGSAPAETDSEDTVAHRAVALCAQLIVDHLQEGMPAGVEPSPEQVLDSWFPYVFEARLDRSSWAAVPEVAVPGLLAAPYRTAWAAYEGYAARMDHFGTRRLLDELRQEGPELFEQITERREIDLRAASAAISRRLGDVRADFAALEAYPGAIDDGDAVILRGLLLDVEHPLEDDLLQAATCLDEAKAVLSRASVHVTASLLTELSANDVGEDDDRAVRELLAQNAFAAAHERLDALRRGGAPLGPGSMEEYRRLQSELWSAGIETAGTPNIFDTAVTSLQQGRPLPPFGPGPAEPAMRDEHAEALTAWRGLFRDKKAGDFDGRLRSVLALLALPSPAPRSEPAAPPRGTDLVVDVGQARPVLPVVMHELGSGARGRYRVHVVWGQMSADRLVSLVLNDQKNYPHLVLYQGVLTRNQRDVLAAAARDETASSRRILVVDPAVILMMAFHPAPTFALLEHLVLPFAYVSAFTPDVAGNVPPELFRGRRRELEAILDPRGSSFVYGGRQVGKSALLRAAAREVEDAKDPDRRAIYLDVRSLGLGLWRDSDEFWLELLQELQRAGVITDRSSKSARGEAAVTHLRNWFDAIEGRTLLVLLDEFDDLLDADAGKDFPIVERLRGLMNVTDRRFKVVLAGLHQVQRFERQRNVPLAHFAQQPVNVGPLDPADAVALLGVPLAALGYSLSDAAMWHLLSETNYQAGMVQVFGQALLRHLLATPRRGRAFPTKVERSDVERVYKDADLGEQMRRRFMLTINLDDRYRCIAFVLALRNLQQGMNADYEEGELRDACTYWWPEGFASMRPSLFAGLVDEMVGLGVVVRVGGRLRVRNPNVVRLLGSRPNIEAELLDFEGHQPSPGFQASLYRRPLPSGGRSPLSEEELAALVEVDAPGLTLVGGSIALGIEQVVAAVATKLGAHQPEITLVADVPPEELAERMASAEDRVVLAADCRKLTLGEAVKIAQETQSALDKMPPRTAMRRALMVLGAEHLTLWADFVTPVPGLERTTRLGLRRLDQLALEAWVGEERLELDRPTCAVLANATGGWPAVLDRVLRKPPKTSWGDAAAAARDQVFATGTFLADASGKLPDVEEVVRTLVEVGEPVTWEFLADLVGAAASDDTRKAIAALQLTRSDDDELLEVEPFLAEALKRRS